MASLKIVQMAVTRTLSLAKTSVVMFLLIISTTATTAVAFSMEWLVVRRTNHCVKTAVIWNSPYVRTSVTIRSKEERIHIVGLVPMAPRSVFPTHLDAIKCRIVKMVAMKVIVRW